jgi:hypothetical protein
MFIASQIPVSDARSFVPEDTGKLPLPDWPGALVSREFVRGLGGVKARRRGGVAGWAGELVYCDARRGLRLAGGAAAWAAPAGGPARLTHRRFLSDGGAVTRIELGTVSRRDEELADVKTVRALIRAWLQMPFEVRSDLRSWVRTPLAQGAGEVASMVLRSTTRAGAATAGWWVEAGRPIVLIERDHERGDEPPALERRVPALAEDGLFVSSEPFDAGGRPAVAWLINKTPSADGDALRRLRIHLFRLHAERECLGRILREIRLGRLAVERDAPASESLQLYLAGAAGILNRDMLFGRSQDQLLAAAYDGLELVAAGERDDLHVRIEQARRTIRDKIEQVIQPVEYFPT